MCDIKDECVYAGQCENQDLFRGTDKYVKYIIIPKISN